MSSPGLWPFHFAEAMPRSAAGGGVELLRFVAPHVPAWPPKPAEQFAARAVTKFWVSVFGGWNSVSIARPHFGTGGWIEASPISRSLPSIVEMIPSHSSAAAPCIMPLVTSPFQIALLFPIPPQGSSTLKQFDHVEQGTAVKRLPYGDGISRLKQRPWRVEPLVPDRNRTILASHDGERRRVVVPMRAVYGSPKPSAAR